MKRRLWWGITALLGATVAASDYAFFVPKIGHASKAQIEAALPVSLKVVDPPDSVGEARYLRLVELTKRFDQSPANSYSPTYRISTPQNEALLAKLETILDEGGLRVPIRSGNTVYFYETSIKKSAQILAIATDAATRRQDRLAADRWANLGVRLGQELVQAGGGLIDQLISQGIEGMGAQTAFRAEIEGGLSPAGCAAILKRLPERDGSSPEMADALRREFQWLYLPVLRDPQGHTKQLIDFSADVVSDDGPREVSSTLAGTLDPVATASLVGRINDSMMSDWRRPITEARRAEEPLIDEAAKLLPVGFGKSGPEGLAGRMIMNLERNTIGRKMAVSFEGFRVQEMIANRAALVNLFRAAVLLRSGKTPQIRDPWAKGFVRFDRKRKMVWSVGQNGRDDGGKIDKGGYTGAEDYGFFYGDNSWKPLPPGERAASHGVAHVPATAKP